jgi:hypothetical protein
MKSLNKIRSIKSIEKLNKALDERAKELMRRCDLDYISKIEWANIKTQNEWNNAKQQSTRNYFSGNFLIDSIGGAKNNHPEWVAVLLQLRIGWIDEYQLQTIPELIILDFALISYFHYLKLNNIIGNLEWATSFEFFDQDNPKIKYDKKLNPKEFSSEEHVQKMTDSLLPSLDRFNKMFLRNLKALRDLKRSNAVLNIGKVDQINIGERQVNIAKSSG